MGKVKLVKKLTRLQRVTGSIIGCNAEIAHAHKQIIMWADRIRYQKQHKRKLEELAARLRAEKREKQRERATEAV